ncbi:hypothetical protein FRC03_008674 [Tulasnella sp. 419]|nr:hypothetical protein FRC03_008674 [Tulasnella sp. 419]
MSYPASTPRKASMEDGPSSDLKRKREASDEEYESDGGEVPDFIGGVVRHDDPDSEVELEYGDEPSRFGAQVLPVADLPNDFSGEPMDGMQYLFTVRRDAMSLPLVTRAENPYENPAAEPELRKDTQQLTRMPIPSDEWKHKFEERFISLRQNVKAAIETVPRYHGTYPSTKDREGWWKFINGRAKPGAVTLMPKPSVPTKCPSASSTPSSPLSKADVGAPEDEESDSDDESVELDENSVTVQMAGIIERMPAKSLVSKGVHTPKITMTPGKVSTNVESSPSPNESRPPPTSLIVHLDNRTALHILMFFGHWIRLRLDALEAFSGSQDSPVVLAPPILSENDSSWILSLLARLDDSLSSQQLSTLRTMTRECMSLLKWSLGAKGGSDLPDIQDSGEIRCWMVVAAVSKGWGQFDLWEDAVEMFRRV